MAKAPHFSPLSSPLSSRILIVDDEPHVRKFLRLSLQTENFNVLEASTAEEAITLVHNAAPDLMILDLGLPDLDGRQVISDVRLISDMPILVLSGRTEDSEKIAALEQGADDYMTKPFAVSTLIGRVRAALNQRVRQEDHDGESVETGNLSIFLREPAVRRGADRVPLSIEEHAVLRLLALHGGRVMTHGRMARALWGEHDQKTGHQAIQKRINALRYKLETEPSFPRYILTEAAIGYRLEILPPELP